VGGGVAELDAESRNWRRSRTMFDPNDWDVIVRCRLQLRKALFRAFTDNVLFTWFSCHL